MLAFLLDRLSDGVAWRRLIVVAATNRIDTLPTHLRRPGRLEREVFLSPPNAIERLEILKIMLLQHMGVVLNDGELQTVAEACVGYVPADLAALLRESMLAATEEKVDLSVDHLTRAMNKVGASALRDAALATRSTTTWDEIAGDPGGAKTELRRAIEWPRTKRALFERLGLTPPRGILLHGPPGCAKTTLARAAAGASGLAFVALAPADVYASSYVGDAEAIVRRAFTLARSAAPCILFFDEIDAVLGEQALLASGMGRGSSAEARVLSTFLNEMDGVDGTWKDGVLVLGATNRPWVLDAALLRPGRFDKVIYVPPPDYDGRRSILEMQSDRWDTRNLELDKLAGEAVTGNMTGAEIVGACREAAMKAFRVAVATNTAPIVSKAMLEESLRALKPLLSDSTVLDEFVRFEQGFAKF